MNSAALLDFLHDLTENNNREWFQDHKATYDVLRRDFEAAVGRWLPALAAFDPALAGLEPRQCVFRIYRDVRFSSDKLPYKTHFGAYFAAGGKKGTGPGYYVQLGADGQTLLAGGLYDPDKEQLARIRQEIDYNGPALHALLQAPEFRQYYGGLEGEKLKRPPASYPADHPDIELLKHKSFVVAHHLPDDVVRTLDFDTYVPAAFRALRPFCDYLRDALEG